MPRLCCCRALSVVWTTPLVATLGMSLTIPLAMLADMVIHGRRYSAIYIFGCIQVHTLPFINSGSSFHTNPSSEYSETFYSNSVAFISSSNQPVSDSKNSILSKSASFRLKKHYTAVTIRAQTSTN
jgi:hypothetical protein